MKKGKFRVVLDTNVVLAYVQTKSDDSPNKEIIQRWAKKEIDILWTEYVLNEYVSRSYFYLIFIYYSATMTFR